MTSERRRKAMEVAMRRRVGASHAHAEKVKQTMLAQDDLRTTCRTCGQQVRGTLATITEHVEQCNDHREG